MSVTAVVLGFICLLITCRAQDGERQGSAGLPIPFNCPVLVPAANQLNLGFSSIIPGIDESLLPCEHDCKSNHGAARGSCDDKGNCICDYDFTILPNKIRVPILYSSEACTAGVCHCARLEHKELLNNACSLDCHCNHGSNVGTCNYEKKVCVCNYDTPYDSSVCEVKQVLNLDLSKYPDLYQRFYKSVVQVAQIKNTYNVIDDILSNNICFPPLSPFDNFIG